MSNPTSLIKKILLTMLIVVMASTPVLAKATYETRYTRDWKSFKYDDGYQPSKPGKVTNYFDNLDSKKGQDKVTIMVCTYTRGTGGAKLSPYQLSLAKKYTKFNFKVVKRKNNKDAGVWYNGTACDGCSFTLPKRTSSISYRVYVTTSWTGPNVPHGGDLFMAARYGGYKLKYTYCTKN